MISTCAWLSTAEITSRLTLGSAIAVAADVRRSCAVAFVTPQVGSAFSDQKRLIVLLAMGCDPLRASNGLAHVET